jgi:sugar phosphate permease
MATMTFAIGGMAHWMPSYFSRCRGIPNDFAATNFGVITVVAGFLGTFLGGWLGDWYQKYRPGAYFTIGAVGMMVATPILLLHFVLDYHTPILFWATVFAAEFFIFLNTGPGNTIIANVAPSSMRATAFAVNTFFIHLLGDAVSPAILGMFSDCLRYSGIEEDASLAFSMYLMPGMMLASALLFWLGAPYLEKDTARAQISHQ